LVDEALEAAKARGSSELAQETPMRSGSLEPHLDGPSVVSVLANLLEAGGDPMLFTRLLMWTGPTRLKIMMAIQTSVAAVSRTVPYGTGPQRFVLPAESVRDLCAPIPGE